MSILSLESHGGAKLLDKNVKVFLESLYDRGIKTQNALLTEMVRIKLTEKELTEKRSFLGSARTEREQIFTCMKRVTEKEFGYFLGDRDFFYDLYLLGIQIDVTEYVTEVFDTNKGKSGFVLAPEYLTSHLSKVIQLLRPRRALITDTEKFIIGMKQMISTNRDTEFTLITSSKLMYYLLLIVYKDYQNIEVKQQVIYESLHFSERYDFVLSLPEFGKKIKDGTTAASTISEATEAIAIENLLKSLSKEGHLFAVVPAAFTFSGEGFEEVRKYILGNYHMEAIYKLPDGLFRPYTNVKTYLLSISNNSSKSVIIGNLETKQHRMYITNSKEIALEDFRKHSDWRVDLLLNEHTVQMERFSAQRHVRFKLKDIAEVFRGKSIRKDDVKPGKVNIINISNIDGNGQITSQSMDTIDEEERKITRYILKDGDILITCRGTVNKVALFKGKTRDFKLYIPSANIIVIRLLEDIEVDYVKIFLESPIGTKLIKSFQRGTTVMNLNPKDIGEIEIPIVSRAEQKRIADAYNKEYHYYLEEKKKIELRWSYKKAEINESLINSRMFYV